MDFNGSGAEWGDACRAGGGEEIATRRFRSGGSGIFIISPPKAGHELPLSALAAGYLQPPIETPLPPLLQRKLILEGRVAGDQ